jgi:hypothetical protein
VNFHDFTLRSTGLQRYFYGAQIVVKDGIEDVIYISNSALKTPLLLLFADILMMIRKF